VQAGGYKQKQYWVSPAGDDEGWRWVTYRNATHPSFWVAPKALAEYHGGLPDRPYQKDDGASFPPFAGSLCLRSYCCIVRAAWLHALGCFCSCSTFTVDMCVFVSPTSCRLPLAGSEAAGSGSEFLLRAEFDIIPMPWDWPAEVNYHEARAFLNWKGTQDGKTYRMPTVSAPRPCTATVTLYRRRRALVHTRIHELPPTSALSFTHPLV
jgi:hypothetical protein